MAVIETWFEQDLQKPVKVHYIDGNLFSHNGNGNRIGVVVTNNGEAVTLTGTVSGYAVLADGTTVPCTGTRSGNKASILVPAAAYSPGSILISIFLKDGTTVTTLAALSSSVIMARTNNQVSPGSVVTDWTNTINAAMQSVETAAANLGNIVATPYANLTFPVPLGKYTIYNNGLYRCISPIASSETWTAAHWKNVKLGDDVADLKSALDNNKLIASNLLHSVDEMQTVTYTEQIGFYYYKGNTVTFTANHAYHAAEIAVSPNEIYAISGAIPSAAGLAIIYLVDANRQYVSAFVKGADSSTTQTIENLLVAIPNNVAYMLATTLYGVKELSIKKAIALNDSISSIINTITEGNSVQMKNTYAKGFINSSGGTQETNYCVLSQDFFIPTKGISFMLSDDVIIMPIRYTWYNNAWSIDSYPNTWYNADTIANYVTALPFVSGKRFKVMIQFRDQHAMTDDEATQTNWNEKMRFIDGENVYSAIDTKARNEIHEIAGTVDSVKPWAGKKILSLGDSYTYLNYYGKYLAEKTGCTQRGRGWNGGYICYVVADKYSSGSGFIDETFDAALLSDYDIVTVMAGTNNYGYGPSLLGSMSDPIGTGADDDSVYSQLKYVIDKILTIKPTVQLVFCTEPYRLEFSGQPTGGKEANNRGYTMQDVANAIKEVCNYYAIPCFDFHSESGWNEYTIGLPHETHDFTNNPLTYDGLHPRDGVGNGAYWLGMKFGAFINNLH